MSLGVRVAIAKGAPHARSSHVAALLAAGHEVDDVDDGVALLELIGDDPPEVVILDDDLDGLTCLDVLAELQEAAALSSVVLLASPDQVDLRVAARHLGASAILVKPIAHLRLVQAVQDAARVGPRRPSVPRGATA